MQILSRSAFLWLFLRSIQVSQVQGNTRQLPTNKIKLTPTREVAIWIHTHSRSYTRIHMGGIQVSQLREDNRQLRANLHLRSIPEDTPLVSTPPHPHIHTHQTHTHTHKYAYVHIYVYIYVYMYTCIYTHTCKHAHAHTHVGVSQMLFVRVCMWVCLCAQRMMPVILPLKRARFRK